MKSILVLLTSLWLGSQALATDPEYIELHEAPTSRIEITASGGVALQTGYLTSQSSEGTYIIGVNFLLPGGLMAFEWQGFNANHDTGEFALNNNQSVSVATVSFIPHIKLWNHGAWNIYLGIGFTNVGLYQTGPEYTTNYGTFTYSGLVRYEINPKWSVQYKTQWYNVVQTINDQKTSFEVWNHVLGVGYSFF